MLKSLILATFIDVQNFVPIVYSYGHGQEYETFFGWIVDSGIG